MECVVAVASLLEGLLDVGSGERVGRHLLAVMNSLGLLLVALLLVVVVVLLLLEDDSCVIQGRWPNNEEEFDASDDSGQCDVKVDAKTDASPRPSK